MPSFVTQTLFFAGLASIAVPILIHILNKRRYKRVDWGAMEFLRRAQHVQRRRIRLEELLLLALRCLALILFGLALARPFFTGAVGQLVGGSSFERVIIIDDSMSMGAGGSLTAPVARARDLVGDWLEDSAAGGSGDRFTVFTTTKPSEPLLVAAPVVGGVAGEILEQVNALDASDRPGDLLGALREVQKHLGKGSGDDVNRVVYLLGDLRQRDWSGDNPGDNAMHADVSGWMRKISDLSSGFFVMDLADDNENNIALEAVAVKDKALVGGVPTEFEVSVRNFGKNEARDIGVRLSAGTAAPLSAAIEKLGPGESQVVPFPWTFPRPDIDPGPGDEERSGEAVVPPVSMSAEIDTGDNSSNDVLSADNSRFFSAQLVSGIQTLVVDGDTAGTGGYSESYFLAKALAPPGQSRSGVTVTVADESDLASLDLGEFSVIVLCNVFSMPEDRVTALEGWTRQGGGLVFALGDQVDTAAYNELFYKNGEGLIPVQLGEMTGDDTEDKWEHMETVDINHPVLRFFSDGPNALRDQVKVFRWWQLQVPEKASEAEEGKAPVRVVARFTGADNTPAFVEAAYGEGRVFVTATPLDADWSDWPLDVSYLVFAQELVRHMAMGHSDAGNRMVGEPMVETVDLADFSNECTMTGPTGDVRSVQARPASAEEGSTDTRWRVEYDDTSKAGFYRLTLQKAGSAGVEQRLFAVNRDPAESNLKRVNIPQLNDELREMSVELVRSAKPLAELGVNLEKSNLWRVALYALLALLCVELWLGWRIGVNRG